MANRGLNLKQQARDGTADFALLDPALQALITGKAAQTALDTLQTQLNQLANGLPHDFHDDVVASFHSAAQYRSSFMNFSTLQHQRVLVRDAAGGSHTDWLLDDGTAGNSQPDYSAVYTFDAGVAVGANDGLFWVHNGGARLQLTRVDAVTGANQFSVSGTSLTYALIGANGSDVLTLEQNVEAPGIYLDGAKIEDVTAGSVVGLKSQAVSGVPDGDGNPAGALMYYTGAVWFDALAKTDLSPDMFELSGGAWRIKASWLTGYFGDLATLATTAKATLVAAINELQADITALQAAGVPADLLERSKRDVVFRPAALQPNGARTIFTPDLGADVFVSGYVVAVFFNGQLVEQGPDYALSFVDNPQGSQFPQIPAVTPARVLADYETVRFQLFAHFESTAD